MFAMLRAHAPAAGHLVIRCGMFVGALVRMGTHAGAFIVYKDESLRNFSRSARVAEMRVLAMAAAHRESSYSRNQRFLTCNPHKEHILFSAAPFPQFCHHRTF
jgi:hypothetical protein